MGCLLMAIKLEIWYETKPATAQNTPELEDAWKMGRAGLRSEPNLAVSFRMF